MVILTLPLAKSAPPIFKTNSKIKPIAPAAEKIFRHLEKSQGGGEARIALDERRLILNLS
jgi:hypothetical protein